MSQSIRKKVKDFSDKLDKNSSDIFVILAAGHGKRIKSEVSKMMHCIWGKTTVNRIIEQAEKGFGTGNSVLVTGIKADDVIESIGKKKNRLFVLQDKQLGTGHAVEQAVKAIPDYVGNIYILNGDMGLLDRKTLNELKKNFKKQKADMTVMTGMYQGDDNKNHYGRIVRVPCKDDIGRESGSDKGKVLAIIEYKDIKALKKKKTFCYRDKNYSFTKKDLLAVNEYNSGVFAMKFSDLKEYIKKIGRDNAQGEMYLTDLVGIYNENAKDVYSMTPDRAAAVMGFNNKTELKQMENVYRREVYAKLADVITIIDEDDFYIADSVIEDIIRLDKKCGSLDIVVNKGAELHSGVRINNGLHMGKNSSLKGEIKIGKNVYIGSGVQVKGSRETPTIIGNGVTIKGMSYIENSCIGENVLIEHCILKNKKIDNKHSKLLEIKNYMPEGKNHEQVREK